MQNILLWPSFKEANGIKEFQHGDYCLSLSSHFVPQTLFLGPQRADRSRDLVHDLLDIERDSDSDSEDRDQQHRRRQQEDSDSWWWTWGSSDRTDRRQQRQGAFCARDSNLSSWLEGVSPHFGCVRKQSCTQNPFL